MLTVVVVLLVLAAVALVIAIAVRASGKPEPAAVPDMVAETPPVVETPEQPEEPAITWTAELTAETLDEAARVRLIDDLVLLGDEWAVALLRRAGEEERSPRVRSRVEEGLVKIPGPHLLGRT